MREERVVEISLGGRSQGSGYLVSTRHVLTASHVATKRAKRYQVQPLYSARSVGVGSSMRPPSVPATVGWRSSDESLDMCILKLDQAIALPAEPVRWAAWVGGESGYPRTFFGIGFPAAAGDKSYPFFGHLTRVSDADRFDLHIGSALPGNWRKWAGASGTMIFCDGHAIGVVCRVDAGFQGKLTATPLQRLLDDVSFGAWWEGEQRLPLPVPHVMGSIGESPLELIGGKLHRLDRADALSGARRRIAELSQAGGDAVSPQVLVVTGLQEDWHHKLIQHIGENADVQHLLGREARPEEVIVELPWPREERIDAPAEALATLLQPLYRASFLAEPTTDAKHDADALKELAARLDDGASPRAYWTLLHRRQAYGGHGALLRSLLQWWAALPTRRPQFLFVCLALDEPAVAPQSTLAAFFLGEPPQPETDLQDTIERALMALGDRVRNLPTLTPIHPHHIKPWIDDLRSPGRAINPVALDLFSASLQMHLQQKGPMRLAPLSASLSGLLLSALNDPAMRS